MTNLPISIPNLPDFAMTDEEVQQALELNVDAEWRGGEITIAPERGKPKYVNRVLIKGIELWKGGYGDIPLATLQKHLLLLFFLGRLRVVKRGAAQFAETDDEEMQPEGLGAAAQEANGISDALFLDPNEVDLDEPLDDAGYDFSALKG